MLEKLDVIAGNELHPGFGSVWSGIVLMQQPSRPKLFWALATEVIEEDLQDVLVDLAVDVCFWRYAVAIYDAMTFKNPSAWTFYAGDHLCFHGGPFRGSHCLLISFVSGVE